MDVKRIEELIKVLESSRTEELSVRKGDVSVHIRKGRKIQPPAAPARKRTASVEKTAKAHEEPSGEQRVLAPMVGIFHAVDGVMKPGSRVSAGQVVGAIESMKLLNDVVSDVSGVVGEVMVDEGSPVEYGQALCTIESE